MTESEALVVRLEGDYAWLEVMGEGGGCSACHKAGSCGAGDGRGRIQRFPNTIGARVGDHVVVRVADGTVFKSVLWAYLVPIVLVLAAAAVGMAAAGDAGAVAGALAGLGGGWLALRRADRRLTESRESLLSLQIKPVVVELQRKRMS